MPCSVYLPPCSEAATRKREISFSKKPCNMCSGKLTPPFFRPPLAYGPVIWYNISDHIHPKND